MTNPTEQVRQGQKKREALIAIIKEFQTKQEVIALDARSYAFYFEVFMQLHHRGVSPLAKLVKGFE